MIQALAAALAMVLARFLIMGSALHLGPSAELVAPAVFALSVGLGLLARARLHVLAYSLGLALLVPARGPLADLVLALGSSPSEPSLVVAAAFVSLAPVGFLLGRVLASLPNGGAIPVGVGLVLAELACMSGAVGWLPGPFTGFVMAGAFAGLAEWGRERRLHRDGGATEEPLSWEAAPLGFALGVAWLTLTRVVPSYVTPPAHVDAEVGIALVGPALLVAWPASVLASGKALRRMLLALGFVMLGYALWKLAGSLALYRFNMPSVALQTEFHQKAARWSPVVTAWRAWLFMFCGLAAAATGVTVGSLGKACWGPLALGLGAALAAGLWLVQEPALGPQQLLVAAAGVAALGALASWKRMALLAVPAGVFAVLLYPQSEESAYESIRRVGEPVIESFERTLATDVVLFATYGPSTPHIHAQRAYRTSFTHREPLPEWKMLHGTWGQGGHSHGHGHSHEEEEEQPFLAPLAPPEDLGDADLEGQDAEPQRRFGLRFGGVPAHPDHDPMGDEGSVGRLLRLFGVPGSVLAVGVGAELVASDALDSGLATDVRVSSPIPIGSRNQRVLLTHILSLGLGLNVESDPWATVRDVPDGSLAMALVAPENADAPGEGLVTSREYLGALERALAPDGRCLAWLETDGLDARALRGRVASFADVFAGRSAAFLEMREADAPLLFLVGWKAEAGQLTTNEVSARLPAADTTGFRTRLADWDDLGAMLLLDVDGMARVASDGPLHRTSRPVSASTFRDRGWGAVAGLIQGGAGRGTGSASDPSTGLAQVIVGAPAIDPRDIRPLVEGLAVRSRYRYDPVAVSGSMLVEIVDDVEWEFFEQELQHYAAAAREDTDDPLLHLALASLLGPLAVTKDVGRFAEGFQATGAEAMDSWRLAVLQATMLRVSLQEDAADQALARARDLADWTEED